MLLLRIKISKKNFNDIESRKKIYKKFDTSAADWITQQITKTVWKSPGYNLRCPDLLTPRENKTRRNFLQVFIRKNHQYIVNIS